MERLLSFYIVLRNRIEDGLRAQEGQTMIEYALILAVVVLVLVAAFTLTGITGKVGSTLNAVSNKLS